MSWNKDAEYARHSKSDIFTKLMQVRIALLDEQIAFKKFRETAEFHETAVKEAKILRDINNAMMSELSGLRMIHGGGEPDLDFHRELMTAYIHCVYLQDGKVGDGYIIGVAQYYVNAYEVMRNADVNPIFEISLATFNRSTEILNPYLKHLKVIAPQKAAERTPA